MTTNTTRGAWPAPDADDPAVRESPPAASLPRADAPSAAVNHAITASVVRYLAVDCGLSIGAKTWDDVGAIVNSALDAYAVAALTPEQRDVLTVWEWCKGNPANRKIVMGRTSLLLVDYAANGYEPFADIHAAAEWVRAQGGE